MPTLSSPRPAFAAPMLLALLLCSLSFVASAQPTTGGGLAVSPTDLGFGPVLRDEPAERTFTIYNSRSTPAHVTLEPSGEVGAWILGLGTDFHMPANSSREVRLAIAAPDDAPNGMHGGNLTVVMTPARHDEATGFGADVAIAVQMDLTATLGGPQVLKLVASRLTVGDTEPDAPIPLTLLVENRGNVRAAPEVRMHVTDAAGTSLARETQRLDPIRPGADAPLQMRMTPTTLLTPGQYWLDIEVLSNGEPIHTDRATFDVLREGELRRAGAMGAIGAFDIETRKHTNRIQEGQTVQIVVPFQNTGEVDLDARFVGYIAREGRIVQTLETQPLRLSPGEETAFRLLVPDLEGPARYVVAGQVHYGGKVTPENELILTVEAAPDQNKTPAPGIAGLVACVTFVVWLRTRRPA